MFKKNQFTTFNNIMFSAERIQGMEEMHPSAQRLYTAAMELRDVKGQSAVARLLGVLPQVMRNWEKRGVSESGALAAQRFIGCDANWVLTGEAQMAYKPTPAGVTVLASREELRPYGSPKQWPFATFTPEEYFGLLDSQYRQTIEDQLLGAITRVKQAAALQLSKHG